MPINTDQPSIVDGMSFKDYLADPCETPSLSSSIIRSLLETAPQAVWHNTERLNPAADDDTDQKFDLGKAAHGELIGGGERIVIVPFDSYRKAEAKAIRDEAYAKKHIPILEHQYDDIQAMAEAARLLFAQNPDIGEAFKPERQGVKAESSIFWGELGVANRCRPDLLMLSADGAPRVIHYKSTGQVINQHMMGRYGGGLGWHIIGAHYAAGIRALTGREPEQYFAVQENKAPYVGMVVKLGKMSLATGEMRRSRALQMWARCVGSGEWPGHISRTVEVDISPYMENDAIIAKDTEEAFKQTEGKDLLDVAYRWQAPIVPSGE